MIWLAAAATMMMSGQEPDHLPADCADADTTLEVNACMVLDARRETERLSNYLQAAYVQVRQADDMGSEQEGWLRASQPAWEAYADIACGAVYQRWREGTIRTSKSLGCRIKLTRERTHFVWREFLSFPGSTPPTLPEPVGPATD